MILTGKHHIVGVCVRRFASKAATQHEGGMDLWKKFSLFGAIPCVGILTFKTILDMKKHGHDERPPFVAYDHLRIRNKRFPWGDGRRSLFHNPHTNPLPDGYEA
ncbi:cytochrome c oxidase subunit 6A1, mitochondrial isoform X2 [Folsomia candida]|uniref:cytochrome c oxidase subunit 6A1, mitochondrial isoform X2 n=1 Tax=Folsomia candida TaxID=158441 RepID=UPI000B8FE2D8|nr:cytochrome c oxidase subunit 6A1, mitochondrial isoform X2 [Folsomia candida]